MSGLTVCPLLDTVTVPFFMDVTNTNHESALLPKNYVRSLYLSSSFSVIISSLNGNFRDVLIK